MAKLAGVLDRVSILEVLIRIMEIGEL